MNRLTRLTPLVALMFVAVASPATAADLTLRVTNATHGIWFTPLLVTAHGPSARLFHVGTEANCEAAATIPGPAGGGEGYVSDRDDANFVAFHPGIVTTADGLSGSALGEAHRFNWPAAIVDVRRVD